MYADLFDILAGIARDPEVRVVVITGAGRGFCSGHDGSAGGDRPWVPDGVGRAHVSMYTMGLLNKIAPTLRAMPQPVIAAVNGAAAGIGYAIALGCDVAVAGSSAKFVNAFHNAGTGSECGVSYMLPRAVGSQRAAELLLTARPVLAEEAERIGLVTRAVPDDQLMDEVLKIAQAMVECTPLDLWLTKQSLYANEGAGSLEQATVLDHRASMIVIGTDDQAEKRAARGERRPPKFHSR
jgi:enoyl-CoA hydratase